MTPDEVGRLVEGLSTLLHQIEEMPLQLEMIDAKIHCSTALEIATEYARHLRAGKEPYDALRAAAMGEFNTGDKLNVWNRGMSDE